MIDIVEDKAKIVTELSSSSLKISKTTALGLKNELRCTRTAPDLESVGRVHEEVPSQVVEHDGVGAAVLRVLEPDHSESLHLERQCREFTALVKRDYKFWVQYLKAKNDIRLSFIANSVRIKAASP